MSRRRTTNIRRHGAGWRASPTIHGEQVFSPTFPFDTPRADIEQWITNKQKLAGVDPGDSFTADVAEYLQLKKVIAMPTFRQRGDHLHAWAAALAPAFGNRPFKRNDVLPAHINDIIADRSRTLAPGTVRKQCVSLQSFYVAMNGEAGPNPVWGADVPVEPPIDACDVHALDYADIERALALMPDYRDTKPGAPRELSMSKVCVRVMVYTGFPPIVINAIKPHHLNLRGRKVRIVGANNMARNKGTGIGQRWVELTADAVAAFEIFHAADAYGRVPKDGGARPFKRAWHKAGNPPAKLYALRHSFLTDAKRKGADDSTVARIGLLARGSKMVARYTRAADADVDRAAVDRMSAAWARERAELVKPPRVVNTRGRR